jgi:hypothetical protein
MVSACNDFVSNHGETLEDLLFKNEVSDLAMREQLCLRTKICDKLWSPEAEEQKRDRSPEEARLEQEQAQKAGREAEKERKRAEKLKKKEEAAAKKQKKAAEEEAAAAAAKNEAEQPQAAEQTKEEL